MLLLVLLNNVVLMFIVRRYSTNATNCCHAIDWSVNNSCDGMPVGRPCFAPVDRMSASCRRAVVVVVRCLPAANYCDLSPFRSLRNAPYVRPRAHAMREQWPVLWTAFHYNHCRLKIIHGESKSRIHIKFENNSEQDCLLM